MYQIYLIFIFIISLRNQSPLRRIAAISIPADLKVYTEIYVTIILNNIYIFSR